MYRFHSSLFFRMEPPAVRDSFVLGIAPPSRCSLVPIAVSLCKLGSSLYHVDSSSGHFYFC